MIAGVLQFNSKYKYGRAGSGSELFMFKPLSGKGTPHLVASSKKQRVNHYAVISFLKWDKTKSKLPYGQLVKLIGPCDNIDNTYEAIIYKHQLTTVKAKAKTLTDTLSGGERRDITDLYVFSVDPVGCEDIDDALSIQKVDNELIIGVHIADVSAYFESNGIQIKNYSTIYAPHRVTNMIPDRFAKEICSLKPGRRHYAFSMFAKISTEGEILDYWFEKTIVNSVKAYDYDELQRKIAEDGQETNERLLYEVGRLLSSGDGEYDTHKMVEVFMIMANQLVGKYLFENAPAGTAVFRVHETPRTNLGLAPNKEVSEVLRILESKAAVYTVAEEDTVYFHSGLGISHYTHFTSPIRRYVDVYIHQLLYAVMNKAPLPPLPDISAINDFERNVKRAEREFNKLKMAELIRGKAQVVDAVILDYNDRAVSIYLSDYKILHWINWVNNKDLRQLVSVDICDEAVEMEFPEGERLRLRKFEIIRVKLETTTYNDEIHKKISISIPMIDERLFVHKI